jgi:hypothetical protein
MKNYKDKHTLILKQKYDKRMDLVEKKPYYHRDFRSNKEFKDIVFLLERKFDDKIWWKLLPKEYKRIIIYKAFNDGYDPYNLSKEQIDMINTFKEKNPLTKEIRDYKIKIICS